MITGRPPVFETPEALSDAIDGYFDSLKQYDTDGNQVGSRTPTTAGLALALGYCSRQSLYDQPRRGEGFSYLIKKALTYIEDFHERNLSDSKQPTGSIFWLKNHRWYDKQDINHSGEIGSVDTSALTREQKEVLMSIGSNE